MSHIRKEIIRAAKKLGIEVSEFTQSESLSIINQIIAKYAGGKKGAFLWENFVEHRVLSKDPEAWKLLSGIIGKKKTIMFFNPEDELSAFKLNNGNDLVAILGETFGFEFYLTDESMDYVLCFNHHDYLIGCGNIQNA